MSTGPTRILSWQQMVIEADPNWSREYRQPIVYEFSNGRVFTAPAAGIYLPLPDSGLLLNGAFVMLDATALANGIYPTTAAGLPGSVYENAGFVCGVLAATPQPGAGQLIFNQTNASQLQLFGVANMNPFSSAAGSGVLYLNGPFVCAS